MAFDKDKKPREEGTPGSDNPTPRISSLSLGSSDYAKLSGTSGQGTRLGERLLLKGFYLGSNSSPSTTAKECETEYRIPSICRMRWFPTYGVSEGNGSAISLIANKLYGKIMTVLKRKSLPYDPTAVVMQLMAMDSIYCAYECAVRAYKAANTTSLDNAYLPSALCEACGFDYTDLVANKSTVYFDLATMRTALTEYLIPKDYKMIGRHLDMCKYIYRDSPSNKAQLYVFTPDYLWSWDKVDTHGKLVARKFGSTGTSVTIWKKWSDFKESWNNDLNAILNSTSFKDINAGIRSVWADSDVYTMDLPDITATLEYTQDDAVLSAICNMTPIGTVAVNDVETFAPQDVYPNYFVIQPELKVKHNPNLNTLFNAMVESPSASEFVQMASWHCAFELDKSTEVNTDSVVKVKSCGSEVFTVCEAISDETRPFLNFTDSNGNNHEFTWVVFPTCAFMEPYASSQSVVVNSFLRISVATAFRWHPLLYISIRLANEATLNNGSDVVTMPVGDWNYCAEASTTDIRDWHTAALFEINGLA